MPGQDRDRTAVRPPCFGELAGGFFGRAFLEAEDLREARLHRQVAGRPDVGAAFGEQQVDLG